MQTDVLPTAAMPSASHPSDISAQRQSRRDQLARVVQAAIGKAGSGAALASVYGIYPRHISAWQRAIATDADAALAAIIIDYYAPTP